MSSAPGLDPELLGAFRSAAVASRAALDRIARLAVRACEASSAYIRIAAEGEPVVVGRHEAPHRRTCLLAKANEAGTPAEHSGHRGTRPTDADATASDEARTARAAAPLRTQDGLVFGQLVVIHPQVAEPPAAGWDESLRDLAELAAGELQHAVDAMKLHHAQARLHMELQDLNSGVERRIAERTRALESAAYRDPLTRLGNRRALELDLDTLQQHGSRFTHLLLIDMDQLKAVNDGEGHERGDALLYTFADALRRAFRPTDRLYRLGGDEFTVLLDGNELNARVILQRVREAVDSTRARGFPTVDASAGVAAYPSEASEPNMVLRLADQRMLRDKAARRAMRQVGGREPSRSSDLELAATSEASRKMLLSTINLLARDGELDDTGWAALLQTAVATIPGAQAGSLDVREGDEFVTRAQAGFVDALLGMRQPTAGKQAWYGQSDRWTSGRARVIRGAQVMEHSTAANAATPEIHTAYVELGDLEGLQANLCVPIVVNGVVTAHLNIDNLHNADSFTAESVNLAEEFATQMTALLTAGERRSREAARRRELECLFAVSEALHNAVTVTDTEQILTRQAAELIGTPHAVFMRFEPKLDALRPVSPLGMYTEFPDHVMLRGQGLSWIALTEGRTTRTSSAWRDPKVGRIANLPDMTVMTSPLRHSNGEPIGALVVCRDPLRPFSDLEAQLLTTIASAGAVAIERGQAARALNDRADEFRILAELSLQVGALTDPGQVAHEVLQACLTHLKLAFACFHQPSHAELVVVGRAPRTLKHTLERSSGRYPNGAIERIDDYRAHALAAPELIRFGVRAMVSAPVTLPGGAVGRVHLAWTEALDTLPPTTESIARRAAELIGLALERRAYVQDVEATREAALLALGLALELRDFETAGHTQRVVALSTQLGHRLNLSQEELEGLRQGAYLHDVGKLAIPDQILLKPGKLSAEEWSVMQEHAITGFHFTARIPTLKPLARQVVRSHHERWDGQGYPDQLAGEGIPLLARIFAVCDVYDALTSERPYKRAWTHEEALAEIAAQSGKQFDPRVARLFVELQTGACDGHAPRE